MPDKPVPVAQPPISSPAEPPLRQDTKARIVEATFRCLAARGYAALNVRDIARDAGVNHALINYYFGTKDRLVIAVLDEANSELLRRQRQMYAEPGGFASKWAQARRFYESDVASGFVRVQAELYAASLSNVALREQFLPRIQAWKKVVLEAVRQALRTYRPALPAAFSADAIACLISEYWLGMEFARLIGGDEEKIRHDKAMDAVEHLLALLEASRPDEDVAVSPKKSVATKPSRLASDSPDDLKTPSVARRRSTKPRRT